ncbi:MAG: 50S ribosomal protein L11 [Nanoarchaeota archaeon]|nr:50S ribosomal protein L11 [Nanoarchaeota archaeon]
MIIKLLVEGGKMTPGPAIAQKLGPIGVNIGKVIQDVNQATEGFKGLKVPVELDVDASTKEFKIKVSSPPVSELIKKELGIEKASGEQKKLKAGNLSIEQIIKIAKTKHKNMLDRNLKSAVKSVIGSCVSLGVLVENEEPVKVEEQIVSGKYEKEILEGKTETSQEKLDKLKEYFEQIRTKQEEIIKKEQEEKEAEEEAKKAETEKGKEGEKPEDKKEETEEKEEPKK